MNYDNSIEGIAENITVSLASHPPRTEGMLARVQELLPQLRKRDRLRLYLNNYDELILRSLPNDPRLHVILAGARRQYPDLGSQGKFYNVGLTREGKKDMGYWLVVDDDIHYPAGYVAYMVDGCKKYKDACIVTLHGGTFHDMNNGAFPNKPVRDCRTLIEYWRGRDSDKQHHTAGCGITCFRPSVIGMTSDIISGPLHSGDDEDVALWAQKHKYPIIRLAGRCNWVVADPKVHVIAPLYSNAMSLSMADSKMRAWTNWKFPAMPIPKPPSQGVENMFDKVLDVEEMTFCNKILSSDAFAAIIADRLQRGVPTSVIRMSDGERAAMALAQGRTGIMEFTNDAWLTRYGLLGADMKEVGTALILAGQTANFLACSISGIYQNAYKVWPYFPERTQYIDQFYPHLWKATDRVGSVLASAKNGVLILHRDADSVAARLRMRYHVEAQGIAMSSWRQHEGILGTICRYKAGLILVAGGPAGKPLCVELAKISGKVVLDVGEALETVWVG